MLQLLRNPDYRPAGVVDGYMRQNTHIYAGRVGLDTTSPMDNGTTITIPFGGVVEVNGHIYTVSNPFERTKPNPNTAYWIVVIPSADGTTAEFDLVTRPGVWSPDKNGCYFTSGDFDNRRTLDWVSRGTLANIPTGAAGRVYHENTKRTESISLRRGWYYVSLQSGAGAGNGGNSTQGTGGAIGTGGVANARNTAEMVFFADKPLHNIRIGADGQNGAQGPTSGTTRAGGGGSGAGEESVFENISTGFVPPGQGGNVNGNNSVSGGLGGNPGSNGDMVFFGNDLESSMFLAVNGGRSGDFFGGGGGSVISSGGGILRGGNGGQGGQSRPAGTPGGTCSIWALGN